MVAYPLLPGLARRPALRPGLHVVRRDADHLQVGVDPPSRVVVPDEPGVRRLLADLRGGAEPTISSVASFVTLRSLLAADLLVDADESAADRRRADATSVLATRAHFGVDARRRLDARRDARIGVRGSSRIQRSVSTLMGTSGLQLAGHQDLATAWLVVADGELSRGAVDPFLREGAPHLVLTGAGGRLRLGPFVVPGQTACLRCVDAHQGEADPRRQLVVEQVARLDEQAPGVARDPLLETMSLAWAVRDLLRFVEGDAPSTWSATVTIDAQALPERREWQRHPHCGCAWDELP